MSKNPFSQVFNWLHVHGLHGPPVRVRWCREVYCASPPWFRVTDGTKLVDANAPLPSFPEGAPTAYVDLTLRYGCAYVGICWA